jgi:hypothetical protein
MMKRKNTPAQRINKTPPNQAAFSQGLTQSRAVNIPVPTKSVMDLTFNRRSRGAVYKQDITAKTNQILNGNVKRSSFIIQNRGAQAVYIAFGSRPTAPDYYDALEVVVGGSLVFEENAPIDDVWCVTKTGTTILTVFEGVFL